MPIILKGMQCYSSLPERERENKNRMPHVHTHTHVHTHKHTLEDMASGRWYKTSLVSVYVSSPSLSFHPTSPAPTFWRLVLSLSEASWPRSMMS